ncbi:helix-turn-helix domain-containing protein [Flavobacterium difficile]|nr:helix-turn-helix domain-containing protein [Flavobacterium difficile]
MKVEEKDSLFISKEQKNTDEDVLMTRKKVAELLKISLVTLNNHNRNGILKPTHKIGRRILYKKSDVLRLTQIVF